MDRPRSPKCVCPDTKILIVEEDEQNEETKETACATPIPEAEWTDDSRFAGFEQIVESLYELVLVKLFTDFDSA